MKSKWIRKIKGLEHIVGYKVYINGDIESYIKRYNHSFIVSKKPNKKLKPTITKKGYLRVDLKGKGYSVHRLVAMAFIPNPLNKPQVNHIDGNKNNNNVKNLEWCTNSENQKHAVANGLHRSLSGDDHYTKKYKLGEHHNCIKVCCIKDGIVIKKYNSFIEAAKDLKIDPSNISKAIKYNKKALGFNWEKC